MLLAIVRFQRFHRLTFSFLLILQNVRLVATTSIMADKIPAFTATPEASIPGIAKEKRLAFAAQTTKPLEWRLKQLRKLYWG